MTGVSVTALFFGWSQVDSTVENDLGRFQIA